MAPDACTHCGAQIDAYMTTCAACRRPIAPQFGTPQPRAVDRSATEPYGADTALLAPPQTRSGEPASSALAWVIAVLPIILMLAAIAAGWWPHPVVLIAQMVLVLAVCGWDSRTLDRELIDVSWFWALLTPATYLFIRAARTGRGHVAAWCGLVSTSAWFVGILVGTIVAIMASAPVASYQFNQELRTLSSAGDAFRTAQVNWSQAPGNSGAGELQAAARDLTEALDAFRAELIDDTPPEELKSSVSELSASVATLSDEINDVATADGLFDLGRQQCEASMASYANSEELVEYLTAINDPQVAAVARLLPASQASADYCSLSLPLLDSIEDFVASMRNASSVASVRSAYADFATGTKNVTSGMRDQSWPDSVDDEMEAVIAAYDRAAAAASRVVKALDRREFPAARQAGREMAQELKVAGAAEESLSSAWNEYAQDLVG